jgi:RHS repeat-associated protein
VEESRNQTNLPYKFTGKELDPETGLYYFGARYYDPQVSIWVSVDPILKKYLSGKVNGGVLNSKNLGLYSYTYNNPVILIDPNGKDVIGIAMFKEGVGRGTFSGRATRAVENAGGSRRNVSEVHTGQEFINALVNASKKEPIDKLYVASHSGPVGLYGDSNSGFYSGPVSARLNNLVADGFENYEAPTDSAAFLSDLKEKIKTGEIKFSEDAEIVFLGCNTARGGFGLDSFVENLSEDLPSVFVTGAEGYSRPANARESSFEAKKYNPDRPENPSMDWVTYKDGKQVRNHGSIYSPGNE